MSQEVKQTIMTNNSKRITNVYPIDITSSEKTLNILNDIALIHSSDIISALKGQTISQEIKKGLSRGKEIIVSKNSLIIEPLCSNHSIQTHKNFLIKRAQESSNNENKKLIQQRYKNLNSKSIEIILPEILLSENYIKRELDYLFRFLCNLKYSMCKVNIGQEKCYYIPHCFIRIAEQKSKNLKKMFNNVEKLIVFKQDFKNTKQF